MDIEKNNIKIHKAPFIISNYMLYCILPKCHIVYGEVISSIYFQIAININNQKNANEWKRNKSWISIKSISKNTGYNIRIINKALKTLQYLNLITIDKQLKNKTIKFNLINNNFDSLLEFTIFNNNFNKLLLSKANKIQSMQNINLITNFEESLDIYNSNIVKKIMFNDINLLRKLLIEANNIYKGSSLFFITNIAPAIFQYNNQEFTLQNISQEKRALKLGVSQSTISRYIEKYRDSNYISIINPCVNKPITLGLDAGFVNKNLEKVVINNMNTKIICPICGKEFYENRSLGVHISKTKDSKHILLNYLKNQHKNSTIDSIYNEFKEEFIELNNIDMNHEENKVKVQAKKCEYLNVPCSCKMTCKECYKNWKSDYYDDCTHQRKEAFIQECLNKEDKKLTKVASKASHDNITDEIKVTSSKKAKVTTKNNTIRTPDLVKYFYNQIDGTSPNFAKECGQVKNLLKKNTADEIKLTMDYLKRRGNMDLRFLNNSVKDALAEQQYLKDADISGTEANLVKMYYEGLGQQLNIQTLVRDVQKVKETINSGNSYEQVKLTIQYMVNTKCPTINFIGSKVNEAKTKNNTISIKNNPAYYDRSALDMFRSLVINADTSLKNVSNDLKDDAIKIVVELFKENKFTDELSHFEWAWIVGLNLDLEMYNIAQSTVTRGFSLDKMLQDSKTSSEDRKKAEYYKGLYEKWLADQLANINKTQVS